MNPPVRMVCGDCLRSVELAPDESGQISNRCPVCHGYIDDVLSDASTQETRVALSVPKNYQPDDGNLWTETWTKGSLGTVGRFQIRETLGDGGFGHVSKAYDPRLDRDVALKVLKHSSPSERVMQRFFREARAVAKLKHPNIVAVYDAGLDGQRIWIAYEFIDGRPLTRYLESQSIDIPSAIRIAVDIARALEHAHRQGIYHRDLKPANVIVDNAGIAYLIDFGLSRRADVSSNLTRDGAILGTPDYMPPEQANGRSHLADERSDIYSLGVILFELLCGRRPSDIPSQISGSGNQGVEPPALRAINGQIPLALERICLKALAADPAMRYRNAHQLSQELEAWLYTRDGLAIIRHPAVNFLLGAAGTLLVMSSMYLLAGPAETPSSKEPIAVKSIQQPKVEPPKIIPMKPSVPKNAFPYVGNPTKHVIHTADCRSARSLGNPVPLKSLKDAVEKGYAKDCQNCSTLEIQQALANLKPSSSAH